MFNLSIQATIYLIVLILTSIINIICISIAAGPLGFLAYTLYAILAIPFFILYVYNVDCLTSGDCQIWSWVVAIFSSISLLITAVVAIYLTAVPPKTTPVVVAPPVAPVVTPVAPVVAPVVTPVTPVVAPVVAPVAPVVAPTPTVITPSATAPATAPATVPLTAATIAAAQSAVAVTVATATIPLTQEQTFKFFEQQQKILVYMSNQITRTNLTREEKNELWRQYLENEYQQLLFGQKDMQTYLYRPDLAPNVRDELNNMLIIHQRLIKQREEMQIEYPPLLGLNSLQIESIKLQLKHITQQMQYILSEIDKPGLPTAQAEKLMAQYTLLQRKEHEITPQPGNYLYDAYTASLQP